MARRNRVTPEGAITADPARGLGFAYVTNRMLGFDNGVDPRRARLLDAVYAALA